MPLRLLGIALLVVGALLALDVLPVPGRIVKEIPTGDFYVNGVKVGYGTTLNVNSPKLEPEFRAYVGVEDITDVWVEVFRDSSRIAEVHLTRKLWETRWLSTYYLPSQGTYVLECYYTYAGARSPVLKGELTVHYLTAVGTTTAPTPTLTPTATPTLTRTTTTTAPARTTATTPATTSPTLEDVVGWLTEKPYRLLGALLVVLGAVLAVRKYE